VVSGYPAGGDGGSVIVHRRRCPSLYLASQLHGQRWLMVLWGHGPGGRHALWDNTVQRRSGLWRGFQKSIQMGRGSRSSRASAPRKAVMEDGMLSSPNKPGEVARRTIWRCLAIIVRQGLRASGRLNCPDREPIASVAGDPARDMFVLGILKPRKVSPTRVLPGEELARLVDDLACGLTRRVSRDAAVPSQVQGEHG